MATAERKPGVNISSPPPSNRGLVDSSWRRRPVESTLRLSSGEEETPDGAQATQEREDEKGKTYQCSMCPDDPPYAGASGLWYHMKRHHGAQTRPYNKRKDEKIGKKPAKADSNKKSSKPKAMSPKKKPRPTKLKETPGRPPKNKLIRNGDLHIRTSKLSGTGSRSESPFSEFEDEDEEGPLITRNEGLMSLMKRKWQADGTKDPFLLLAEVAECVSPRKKMKIQIAAQALQLHMNEVGHGETKSRSLSKDDVDMANAFPKPQYALIATK